MSGVLAIGGMDPGGRAGLGAVQRVLALERVPVRPVSTGQTVQDDVAFGGVAPTPAPVLRCAIQAASDGPVGAVVVGTLFGADQVTAVADALQDCAAPVVLDPVHGATAGGAFLDDAGRDLLVQRLVPRAALVTPNAEEARWLTGSDGREAAEALMGRGAQAVLTTHGGEAADVLHHAGKRHVLPADLRPGLHRGTGCRLAARIAGRLAAGMPLVDAVAGAHAALQRELALDAGAQHLDAARRALCAEAQAFLPRLLDALPAAAVPEVGLNFAYALPGATDPRRDVVGLAGRIAIAGDHLDVCGRITVGGPHHTGRMAVVLQEIAPAARIVMNHRLDAGLPDRVQAAGLGVASFSRAEEPSGTPSSMEWGLRQAVRAHRQATGDPASWPAVVWDAGGPGKEPMARLLARGPADLLRVLRQVHAPAGNEPPMDGGPPRPFPASTARAAGGIP